MSRVKQKKTKQKSEKKGSSRQPVRSPRCTTSLLRNDRFAWIVQKIQAVFPFQYRRLKAYVWPVLFWSWVVWVSLWIEHAPVREFVPPSSTQKFSDFQFTDMRFEQRDEDHSLLVVESPDARFHSSRKHFYLVDPVLTWQGKEDDPLFTAEGDVGIVSSHLSDTSLPSEFRILELSGDAHLTRGGRTIDSERMLFDNENRKFYFPDAFISRQRNGMMSKAKGMSYDPRTNRLMPIPDPDQLPLQTQSN